MNLYYAMGGGLGHLTRARAFLENSKNNNYQVITGHPQASLVFENDKIIHVSRKLAQNLPSYRKFLKGLLHHKNVSQFIIDTFPNGILGEVTKDLFPNTLTISYVTRRLKWASYKDKVQPYTIKKTIAFEELEEEHQAFIMQHSQQLIKEKIQYFEPKTDTDLQLPDHLNRPLWIIIHSEPEAEVIELLSYAEQKAQIMEMRPFFLVISNCSIPSPKNGKVIQFYPAGAYYAVADAIFTGCGFNSMNMPVPEKVDHYFIPFPRKYDDQYWRANMNKINQ